MTRFRSSSLALVLVAVAQAHGAAQAATCTIPEPLPPGWQVGPPPASFEPPHRERGVRVPVGAGLPSDAQVKVFRTRPAAYRYGAGAVGKLARLPAHDAPGLSAWAADDGQIVLADGTPQNFRVVVTCVLVSSHSWGAPERCEAVSTRLPGVFVSVIYPSRRLKETMSLVAAAEGAARSGLAGCP